tara:strand:+ start:10512 stop:10898 length:387 start_codon:yes stop_codon:yes gene_type:complete
MNIETYNQLQETENKKQLAIDFDGVIHKNSKGFYDGTIYDEPIEGSIQAIKELAKKYDIVIFTAKAKPDRPLLHGKTGTELVADWLDKYGLSAYVKEITSEKPRAVAYIDDKAIRFDCWNNVLKQIGD